MVELIDTLPAGADVVVRVLPPAAQADYPTLGADYRSALATAGRRAGAGAER